MSTAAYGTYSASASSLSVTDTGDFFQLRVTGNIRVLVREICVFQTSETTLASNAVHIVRGTSGEAGGTGLDEYEVDNVMPSAGATAFSLPTGDVATTTWEKVIPWNYLQEVVWFPSPQFPLVLVQDDNLGISLLNTDSITLGVNVSWQEYGLS